MSNMHTYGTIADKDSSDNLITGVLGTNSTDDVCDLQSGILITLGIGAALMGALVATATNLAVVGIAICHHRIRKRKLTLK